jgi:hypothetical protein
MAKLLGAGIAGIAVMLALNATAYAFLKPVTIGADTLGPGEAAYDSFYDGCVALLTLALPAFLGGLVISRIARSAALNVSIIAFTVAAVVGAVHPYWQVPVVSPHSAHSGFMHYMLRNPIVILALGTLGGWLGGEFASGRFTLDDRDKPHMPGMDED